MARGVPRRKKGESLVKYHDRLSDLIAGAEEAGDVELSERLQRAAGKIARDHESVARGKRKKGLAGPGTYPWYQCVRDQEAKGADRAKANAICGRIRANSRMRYPEYWAAREGYDSAASRDAGEPARKKKGSQKRSSRAADANPAVLAPALSMGMHAAAGALGAKLASNPASDRVPFCALGLDGGPRTQGARDNIAVLDRGGTVLEMWEIHGPADLARFDERHPGLPVFGPIHVLASEVREFRRRASGDSRSTPPVVQVRRSRR